MPEPSDSSPGSPVAADFESAMRELEQLVARLEGGQLALDQLLGSYQRGTELLGFCRDKLSAVENQIKVLDGGELKPWSAA
ncbi:MAG: exodeoxyribonuclease VII small subunit [Betaproteobacteria bacterium]